MNKKLISVLLIISAFAGCTSKSGNGTMNTTGAAPSPALKVSPNTASALITPPAAASGTIQVSTQPKMTQDTVQFYVGFLGPVSQTVTITNPAGGTIATFATPFGSFKTLAPPAGSNLTVTPKLAVGSYTSVTNLPIAGGAPNNTGYDVTAYIDSNNPPDTAVIVVIDTAIISKP